MSFNVVITEHVLSEDYASATLEDVVTVEVIYVPPEVPAFVPIIEPQEDEPADEQEALEEPEAEPVVEEEKEEDELEEGEEEEEEEVEKISIFTWTPPVRKHKNTQSQQQFVIEIEPLVVSESSANETGFITFTFSKPIFIPDPFKNLERKISNSDFDGEIEKFLRIKVSSSYFDVGREEIAIEDYSLASFDSTGFSMLVTFAKPSFITQSLTEMDTLEVDFLKADLFVD